MVRGSELRRIRTAAGIGLRRMATLTGISAGHLSRVESGKRPVSPDLEHRYETITGRHFKATDATRTVDDVRRRHTLGLLATASLGAADPDLIETLVTGITPAPAPKLVGLAEVAAVDAATNLYTGLDLRFGGGLAASGAQGALRWALGMLDGQSVEGIKERLHSAVAALADRVAWAYYDSGDPDSAQRLYAVALNTAANGADRNLRGHIVLNLSTHLYDQGFRSDAVDAIRHVLGDERIGSIERANLHIVAARHCGGTDGGKQAGLRHLGLAHEALADQDSGAAPVWAQQVTAQPGHFDAAIGLALFALGEDEQARARFQAALHSLGDGRIRSALRCRTRLAIIRLRAGDLAGGTEDARNAVTLASSVRSARITADILKMETTATKLGYTDLAAEIRAGMRRAKTSDTASPR